MLAVAGADGSPGRTTIAVNLATCLGAVAPTVLVDGDLHSPAVAAHLDADPTRNVYMLAHAAPRSPLEWDRALEQEVQPLGSCSRHGALLCGVPKLEMRGRLTPAFLAELLGQLAQRYRYVVLDAGDEPTDVRSRAAGSVSGRPPAAGCPARPGGHGAGAARGSVAAASSASTRAPASARWLASSRSPAWKAAS